MATDALGLTVTGSAASAEALNRAVLDYYAWKGDPIAHLREATDVDPAFTLGQSATAALFMLNGARGNDPAVQGALKAARTTIGGATVRERRHLAAAETWAAGRLHDAADIWEDILVDEPTDPLALRFAHDTYFYLGRSLSIRDSVARVLPAWDTNDPLYGYVLGQYAFGLEEAGDLRHAEALGREAIERNAEDGWAVHAVAHVLEAGSRQQEGIAFLKASRPAWGKAHALSVHNGWHLALYLIEEGRFDEVLADYDRHVAPKLVEDSLLDLVDASALLWRIELAGGHVGTRWMAVAAQWSLHIDDHVLVFNDLHIALALARAQDANGVERLLRSLDAYVLSGQGDNRDVTADVGRRIVEGVLDFAEGRYASAIERLLPIRHKIVHIGGSHAQRDLLTQTLISAAEHAGHRNLARSLLNERLALRPTERTRRDLARVTATTALHN